MQGSLSHNNDLPQAFYSSSVFPHRSGKDDWRAQILVGIVGQEQYLLWIEYAEQATEEVDKIIVGSYQDVSDSFESAMDKAERRGYIIEDLVVPNADSLAEIKNSFYKD